jgi:hypothetical protein
MGIVTAPVDANAGRGSTGMGVVIGTIAVRDQRAGRQRSGGETDRPPRVNCQLNSSRQNPRKGKHREHSREDQA